MILFFEEILSTFLYLVLLRLLLAAQVFTVQIILEDDHRGHHIDDFAPFLPLFNDNGFGRVV